MAAWLITDADRERFLSKVEFDTNGWGCWLWTGALSRGRGNTQWYGSFRIGRRVVRAHSFACAAFGVTEDLVLPNGHHRDHICNFSLCVRPDHLEPVTHAVNQQRKIERTGKKPLDCSASRE